VDRVQEEIDHMAAQHDDAPSFLPHVTLIGGLNKTGQEVLETAEKLAGEIEVGGLMLG